MYGPATHAVLQVAVSGLVRSLEAAASQMSAK